MATDHQPEEAKREVTWICASCGDQIEETALSGELIREAKRTNTSCFDYMLGAAAKVVSVTHVIRPNNANGACGPCIAAVHGVVEQIDHGMFLLEAQRAFNAMFPQRRAEQLFEHMLKVFKQPSLHLHSVFDDRRGTIYVRSTGKIHVLAVDGRHALCGYDAKEWPRVEPDVDERRWNRRLNTVGCRQCTRVLST